MRNRLGAILEERYGDCYRKDRAKLQADRAKEELQASQVVGSKKAIRPASKPSSSALPEPATKDAKKRPQRSK